MNDPLNEWLVRSLIGLAFAIVGGIGIAAIRKHNAGAKSQEAIADSDAAESEASATLYKHYGDELADLRREMREMAKRITVTESELAKVEQMYRVSAAGEKRYREAFAELLHIYTDLVGVARGCVPLNEMKRIDMRLTELMMRLAKPLELKTELKDENE